MKFGILAIGPLYNDLRIDSIRLKGEALLAEGLGFNAFLLAEHHLHTSFYNRPFLQLTQLAIATDKIMIGTGACLLPLHHPFALAEESAMVDSISNGRLIFGIALGYVDKEFSSFGVGLSERASRFEEGLSIIERLWRGEMVNHVGKHYTIKDSSIAFKPVQRPRPRIWIGAQSERAVARAAKLGDGYLAGPSTPIGTLKGFVEHYRSTLSKLGKQGELAIIRQAFLSSDRELAWARMKEVIEPLYRETFLSWAHPLFKADSDAEFDRWAQERHLFGSSSDMVQQIERYYEEVKPEYMILSIRAKGISYEEVTRAITSIGKEVLPCF